LIQEFKSENVAGIQEVFFEVWTSAADKFIEWPHSNHFAKKPQIAQRTPAHLGRRWWCHAKNSGTPIMATKNKIINATAALGVVSGGMMISFTSILSSPTHS
jgi:hypothetical protein